MKFKIKIPLRIQLFLPISVIIVSVVVLVTIWFVNSSIKTFNRQNRNTLELEVKTIAKMFERESILKLEKVQTNLKIARIQFYKNKLKIRKNKIEIEATNQKTGEKHKTYINSWFWNGKELYENNEFVDSLEQVISGTITIFQKIDSGFVRICTNIKKDSIARANATFIPNYSEVAKAIFEGKMYFGRAMILNDWYTTAYDPIYIDNKIVGVLYVGEKEKNLEELKKILYSLKIGKSGYPYVLDKDGNMLIHPKYEGQNWRDSAIFQYFVKHKSGIYEYTFQNNQKTVSFTYFEQFELFIAASIVKNIENKDLIHQAILGAVFVGMIAIFSLLAVVYRFTSEKLYKSLIALQISNKKLIDAELALKQSERLAHMGQLSAGIAHELNNPLGVITMYSNLVLDDIEKDSPLRKDLELIVEQTDRCKKIVSGLLNFARKNQVRPKVVNIQEFTNRSLESVVTPPNVTTEVILRTTKLNVMIDPDQMMQVFTNIEKNAIEAMPDGGHLKIIIDTNEDMLDIRFVDSGMGIPKENMDKLFTPFFTTKEVGKGTGLGLPLVYGIVKMHNGKIAIKSNTDIVKGEVGTTFIINLPIIN